MSGKYSKKRTKKKSALIPVLVAVALLLAIALGAMLILRPEGQKEHSEESTSAQHAAEYTNPVPEAQSDNTKIEVPIDLGQGLQITSIANYAGIYMEDGSDEIVTDILMITVENTSEQDLQLAKITMVYKDREAIFQVTNLPSGKKLVALEQNRMSFSDETPVEVKVENVVFVPKFELYEDQLRITTLDGALNIKNISGEDMPGDIALYYKNIAADVFYGGITYRVRIEGGLKADEIRQIMSEHYDAENSKIIMISYNG